MDLNKMSDSTEPSGDKVPPHPHPGSNGQGPLPAAAESVFERALRARNERASRAVVRVTKKPARIRPTTKVKGWFRCHQTVYGPIWIFLPKDEDGFSDEPVFVMPGLAEELRDEGRAFFNAIREVMGYLVYTLGGALYLVLVPLPDPSTGRHHSVIARKIEALEEARAVWKRLDWDKERREYDDMTATDLAVVPEWPDDISEAAILARAFGERNVIRDLTTYTSAVPAEGSGVARVRRTCPLIPYAVDYEFIPLDDGGMDIVCGVAQNLLTGETRRRWRDEMGSSPFFDCGPEAVLVAYNAQAEMEAHRAMGWTLPANVICLFAEHMLDTNGADMSGGSQGARQPVNRNEMQWASGPACRRKEKHDRPHSRGPALLRRRKVGDPGLLPTRRRRCRRVVSGAVGQSERREIHSTSHKPCCAANTLRPWPT